MHTSLQSSPMLRLLRVFNLLAAVASYCARTRGNRLRLFAIFLLLTVAATAIEHFAAPAFAWLSQSLASPVRWTASSSVIRFLADLPLFTLWTIVDAVTVGIVLDVLEPRPASVFD